MTTGETRPHLDPDAIPATLRDVPRWVAWRCQTRNGKPTKTPYDAHGGNLASVSDPATWSPFSDALRTWQTGRYDGIGIVLTGDGIVALDYDNCISDDGTITPDVVADLAALGTYAERSPSGRGVRAFVIGELPFEGRRHGGFEIYSDGRYVTVTGNHIAGMPETIATSPDALAAIVAARLPARPAARRRTPAASSADITSLTASTQQTTTTVVDDALITRRLLTIPNAAALWRGETDRHDGDHSRAEQALACHLVYCGADEAAIARLVASSGLNREKWERDDYRERTIAKAFELTSNRWSETPRRPTDLATGTQDIGADCGADLAELRARISDLEAAVIARDRRIERLQAERDHAAETATALLSIVRNGELGAARMTALGIVVALKSLSADDQPDEMREMPYKMVAEIIGASPSAVGRHIKKMIAMPDSPLRHETRMRPTERTDPTTGEVRTILQPWSFVGMNAASVADFADALATSKSDAPTHGGARPTRATACTEHPDAGAVAVGTLHLVCGKADCGTILATETYRRRVPADQLVHPGEVAARRARLAAEIQATEMQDARRSESTNPLVVDTFSSVQDAFRSPMPDEHRAPGLPLFAGTDLEVGPNCIMHDGLIPPTGTHGHDRWTA